MTLHFRQPSETGPLVTLEHGPYALTIAPGFGARMVSFRHGDRNILRPTPESVLARPIVYGFAGFPLMPYSGPLFGPGFAYGGFTFAGVSYPLARTVREEPSATHGESWIEPFRVLETGKAALDLEMTHEPSPGRFPFRYRGRVRYSLSDDGLAILLSLTSLDHRPMPAGLGIHPYFPRPPGTRLRFTSVGVWPPDGPEALQLGCQPLTEGLDFTNGPDVSAMVVDRLYEGWDGRAEVIAPDGHRTLIEADGALDKMQIYSAWDYPYVCVEPVSNTNDGFNRMAAGVPSHGVRVLEPNRSIEGTVRIRVGGAR
jgi:aldose 1-epimerase